MRKSHLSALALLAFASAAFAAGEKEYVAGMAAMNKGDYREAVANFDQAVGADEGNGLYLEARGVAKALAQDLPGATADLKLAAKNLDPADWEAKGWLGVVNRMAGRFEQGFTPGVAPREFRDYAIAMNDLGQNYGMSVTHGTYYDKQLRRNVQTNTPYTGDFATVAKIFVQRHGGGSGDTGAAMLDHVKSLMASHDWNGALQELGPLVKATPDNDAVLLAYGECLNAIGNVLDARTTFTQILTRQPENGEAYLGRAMAALAAGDAPHAMIDLQQAQLYDTAHADDIRKLLAAATAMGAPEDPQSVLKELQSATATAPQQLDQTAMRLVKAMEAHRVRYDEDYQRRRGELEIALKKDPHNADRLIDFGRYLYEESSIQSETVGPRGETRYYRYQSDAVRQDDIDHTHALLERTSIYDPQNLSAMTLKAEMLLDAKQFDEAEDITRKALAIKPDDTNLLELLAKLLQVDAAYKITAAGNLKQPKDFFDTRFDEYPPVTYHWIIYPTKEELRQAAVYEQQAQQFDDLAQQTIAAAVKAGGRTKLGYYFEGTEKHIEGDLAGAEQSLKKALELDPKYQKAWFELAAIYTEEKNGDDASRTRTYAVNLTQTTDAPWLVAAWYKIPRGQLKGGRQALTEAAALDPADPRIWAYAAILDEATGKRDQAKTDWSLAKALGSGVLTLHGYAFADPSPHVPPSAQQVGFLSAIQMRLALLELEDGNARDASRDFMLAASALHAVDTPSTDIAIPDAMLPDPNLAAGVVPAAESLASLRIRADSGAAYAQWASTSQSPDDTALAAQTYRRMLVDRPLTLESMESFKAIADLGLAELHLKRGELDQARQCMKNGPAVPQDFWQEMRKVQQQL